MTEAGIPRETVPLVAVLALLVVAGAAVGGTAAAQEAVTVDVDPSLSDAPGEETTVTLELVAEGGTVLDRATATVGPNGTAAGEVTLTAGFNGTLDEGDALAVEAEATDGNTGYEAEAAQVTERVTSGGNYTVGDLALQAEPLSVVTDAELAAPPGEETTVRVMLIVRANDTAEVLDTVTTTVGPEATKTDTVWLFGDFNHSHLTSSHDTSDMHNNKLVVVFDAIEGNTGYERYIIWSSHYLRPGREVDDRGKALLEARPATVNATARLSHAPVEETAVTFELVEESGTVVDNATAQVSTDDTETGQVTLAADFENEGVDAGDSLAVVANGTHYDAGVVEVTDDVRPGDVFDGTEPHLEAHREAEFERTDIQVDRDRVGSNGVVTVSVDVENVGDTPGYYDLAIDVDGERVFGDARRRLAPGEKVTDSVDVVLTEPGEHEIHVAEMDNHPRTRTVTVPEQTADVEITRYEVNETALLVNETLAVDVTLENADARAGAVDVPLLVEGSVVATKTVDVGPTATETVTFERPVDDPGRFDVTVGALERTPVVVEPEPSLDDYLGPSGTVTPMGLQAAMADWRRGDIDAALLGDVIDAWHSQDPSSRLPRSTAVPV